MQIINNKEKFIKMFSCFDDSTIYSYFEGVLGEGYVDDEENPRTAVVNGGDFYFLAGEPACAEDIKDITNRTYEAILIPDDEAWYDYLTAEGMALNKCVRYYINMPENFDMEQLEQLSGKIDMHPEYKLELINRELYDKALAEEWSYTFVGNFENFEDFNAKAFGYVVTHNGKIISGASAYASYSKGIEIEISTHIEYRNQGLATICAAKFVAEILKRGLRPHWDAANKTSVAVSKKLGFIKGAEYCSLEVVK